MLKFTGLLKGEMVENKAVSAKQLMEEFGIELPKTLVVSRAQTGKDRMGQIKGGNVVSAPTNISGRHNGDTFFLRYYTSEIRKGKDEYTYLPKKLKITQTKVIDTTKEADVALFLFLHSWCKSGTNDSRFPRLNIVDKAAESRAKMAAQKALADLKIRILNDADEEKILRIVRGFEFNGQRISTTQASDVATARLALLDMAGKLPAQVSAAMDDSGTAVRGIAGLAIDRGDVVLAVGKWNYKDGTSLCEIKPNQEPEAALAEYIMDNERLATFLTKIHKAAVREIKVEIKPENLAPRVKEEPKDIEVDSLELLELALEKGVAYHDIAEGKLFLIKDGVKQPVPAATGVNTIEELRGKAKGFSPQIIGRLKSVLK